MNPTDFVFWIKGYLVSQPTSQTKLDIERMLNQVRSENRPNEGFITTGGATTVSGLPTGTTINYTTNSTKHQLNG